MKGHSIQLEKFTLEPGHSFRVEDQFRLSDFYFWHFHPELELVYINALQGIRHVGTHKSEYQDGDMVLIGSDIPHLNFDYLQSEDYDMIVVHLVPDFYDQINLSAVELKPISRLLKKSTHGIAFSPDVKAQVGEMLRDQIQLSGFRRYTHLLNILYILSQDQDAVLLHDHPYQKKYIWKEQHRLNDLYRYIDANYKNPISLEDAANICHLSKEAFCRYFKKATNQTFIQFLNGYRIAQAKRQMMSSSNLTDIAFSSGFESLAYFSRVFKQVTNENPSSYRYKLIK